MNWPPSPFTMLLSRHTRRREFITLLGGAAAHGRSRRGRSRRRMPADRLPRPRRLRPDPWTAAFVQRLRDLGWIEGRNVAIVYRWAEDITSASRRSRPSLSAARSKSSSRRANAVPSAQAGNNELPIVFRSRPTRWERSRREPVAPGATSRAVDFFEGAGRQAAGILARACA